MPLFYKGIQAAKANKEGVKTWHPALVKMKKVINLKSATIIQYTIKGRFMNR